MESKKYEKIRNRVKKMDFEGKYKQLSKWLFGFSFIGNIGSIFFAYFLLYPIFYNALDKYINLNLEWISGLLTILIMSMFELIKRIIIKNFSFDFVKSKFSLKKISIVYWLLISILLIALSFYFSVNGAIKFSDENIIITNKLNLEYENKVNELKSSYSDKKQYFIDENKLLREKNSKLRDKIIETPLNYVTARKEYQKIIDNNLNIIENNEEKINNLSNELNKDISNIREKVDNEIKKNKDENSTSIIVFIIISTFIELLIISGVYFKVYYELTVFKLNEGLLEQHFKKRDNYLILLNFLYKNGKLKPGDVVTGMNKFKEILKENNVVNSNKLATSFFTDLEYNNIVQTQGKRKYFVVDYETAIKLINRMGENIDIFNKLK